MRRSGRAHYVAHNAVTRVPRTFIYLDAEAHRHDDGRRELQTFRLAVTAFDTINRHTGARRDLEWQQSTSTDELWAWITSKCRAKARTVLVAHNLAYDLRITDAFTQLPALGWQFVAGRPDDGQTWFVWSNAGRTLVCVDSTAWLPTALERLGELIGVPKLDLPDEADDNDAWFARCTRDVEILANVWRRIMVWVEADDLGNWKFSGAGQSWAAFRHRFMVHDLLVHESDDARTAERAAAHTGRCEAWQHGKLADGPYTEWDYTTAYARIGVECPVPIKLAGELHRPTLDDVVIWSARRAVLIECEVTTDEPTLAVRTNTGIRWPVGTFRTTCWENELRIALDLGARVVVERAWIYRRAPALAAFCTWVLDGLDGTRSGVDPVVRLALKHWSRALIGRTAAQWTKWQPWGEAPTANVMLSTCHDVPADERYQLLQLGTQLIRQQGNPDNPDAMVAVMSWVMAESRCRLWAAMNAAGLENVAYVDTDSVIVNPAGNERLRAARVPHLRVKDEWRDLEVLGPRQLIPGSTLRAAGVPRGAVRKGEREWSAEVWSGLTRSLSSGQRSTVEVATRTFVLKGTDHRREHLDGHLTAPFRVEVDCAQVAG